MEKNKIKIIKGGRNLISLNVLLIDNGSDTLNDYLALLSNHKVEIISFRDISTCDFEKYQLIILSDGHSLNVSENFSEINLIRNISIPMIGICYGFQILCFTYGAKIIKLSKKSEGLVGIISDVNHMIFQDKNNFIVSEKHQFAIRNIPAELFCLAHSKDGCEIVEVRGKKQFGFQFHPENNNSQDEGRKIFNNLIKYIVGL